MDFSMLLQQLAQNSCNKTSVSLRIDTFDRDMFESVCRQSLKSTLC